VNVIAAPILAMILGAATLPRRLLAGALATLLTILLDGASAFLYSG